MNANASGYRDPAVDAMKGLLVFGMVYAHVLQFFSPMDVYPASRIVSEYANAITFSGFVFCFGYVNRLAYFSKPFGSVYRRMLATAGKTLIAFYISGVAYRVFVDGAELGRDTVLPVVLLLDIPGWSEFLASFAMLSLLGIALFPLFRGITERPGAFWAVNAALLLTTCFPYERVHFAPLGLLVGTADSASFPVVQYLPYYLTGMYFARHGIRWKLSYFIVASAATGVFLAHWLAFGQGLPQRFPPSIGWIVGPALILYGYCLICRYGIRYVGRAQRLVLFAGQQPGDFHVERRARRLERVDAGGAGFRAAAARRRPIRRRHRRSAEITRPMEDENR